MSRTTLLASGLRRERVMLPIWLLGVTALLGASGAAITREFGDVQERTAVVALAAGNPAFLFLRGLPDGVGLGALVFFQTFSFLAVLIGLMNTFLIVRHTRADEERGRSELLQAAPIDRTAPLTAALTLALLANAAIATLTTCTGLLLGLDGWSATLVGLSIGVIGVCFAGSAALCAQIMPSPRGANGLSAALVGLAYLTRGIGDALGTARDLTHIDPSWLSLLSPIGWAQATRPFSTADPRPLLVPLGIGAVTAAAALFVRARRDLGSSLIPERPGKPVWAGAGATPLAIRSQLGTTLGWAIGTSVLGLLAGALTTFIVDAVGANDDLAALIRRLAPDLQVNTGDLFAIALLGIAGTLATAAGVQAILRLRLEEAEGRTELLLTARQSRTGWYLRQVAVALGATLVVALAGGLSAGLGYLMSGGDSGRIGTSLAAILVHLPAGMVFIGLTALAFAAAPRWTVGIGWGLLVLGLVVGQLGGLIGLPEWIQDVSPFHHVPAVPIEAAEPWPLLLSATAGLAALGAGLLALRRRDIAI